MSVSNTNSPGRVQVSRAIKEWRDGEPVFGPTKSSKPRAVRVPRFLADMLEQQLRSLPGGIDPNALAFTTIRDTNVNTLRAIRREPFVTNHFRPAVKAVVPDKAKLRLHDLRHTYAALMIAQGAQPMTLKALMGHASITTTLDRYGHLFPGHDDEVMDGLDATFNAVPSPDNVVELRGT